MSARQLNRLAKAKGLDPLLGGALNAESQESEESDESEGEDLPVARKAAGVFSQALGEDSDQISSDESEGDEDDDNDDNDDNDEDDEDGGDDDERDAHGADAQAASAADCDAVGPTPEDSPDGAGELGGKPPGGETTSPNLSSVDREQPRTRKPADDLAPGATRKRGATVGTGTATDAGLNTGRSSAPSKGNDGATSNNKKSEKRQAPQEEIEDDSEYLDRIIAQMEDTARSGATTTEEGLTGEAAPLAQMLKCDARCLKLDTELRRKFGRSVGDPGGDEGGGAQGAGAAGRLRRRRGMMPRGTVAPAPLALKRLIVSSPKEDWPKPPSFVGGGLGMSRCEPPDYLPKWQLEAHAGASWFSFERSDSLEQLQTRFEAIQRMHDPNLLAAFASQAPYHADALLQLGIVFAHTGQMDRASEFVARSLYVFESAFMETFRPVEGACRMDSQLDVNKAYLAAMFRHMQSLVVLLAGLGSLSPLSGEWCRALSFASTRARHWFVRPEESGDRLRKAIKMAGMMGGTRTALEVGRFLLSLDPLGDPMGCLVAIDSLALASRQGEVLIKLFESKMSIGYPPTSSPWSARSGTDKRPPVATVRDLPGLSVSVSLAILDTSGDVSAAREAMASALRRFPVMLEPLLEKCGISPRSATYPQNWKSVMHHPHFGQAQDRLPRVHVLRTLARVFAERGGEIWKHERAQELLYDGAGIALQGMATVSAIMNGGMSEATTSTNVTPPAPAMSASVSPDETEALGTAYREGSPLHKYLDLVVTDFSDEGFARLPADANILDPQLMGRNFMNQRMRVQLPPGMGNNNRRDLPEGIDALQAFVRELGHLEEEAHVLRRGQARNRLQAGRRTHRGNLNPEAPLAQLLWQTLLPWNVFPTPSNPPPPHPARL